MLYYVFYMIIKFSWFTCTLLESGMPIRILMYLIRLYKIFWQDWPTFWQDGQHVCQILGSSFYQTVLQDSLILPEDLAKIWMCGGILPPLVRLWFFVSLCPVHGPSTGWRSQRASLAHVRATFSWGPLLVRSLEIVPCRDFLGDEGRTSHACLGS